MVVAAAAAPTFQRPSEGREVFLLAGSQTLPEDGGKEDGASCWAGARLGARPGEEHLSDVGGPPGVEGLHPAAAKEEAGKSLLESWTHADL